MFPETRYFSAGVVHENDIIQTTTGELRFVVEWNESDGRFMINNLDGANWYDLNASIPGFLSGGVEVIGNTHEYSDKSN